LPNTQTPRVKERKQQQKSINSIILSSPPPFEFNVKNLLQFS
jgi:hypothetical protein